MKFRNLHHWELSDEIVGLVYFAQRLDELLFDFTLDSYKPPALNPVSLCREAIEFIEDVEANEVPTAGLAPILEELMSVIGQDPISKSLLDLPLNQYVLNHNDTPPHDTKIRLEVLLRTLDSSLYFSETMDFLADSVLRNHKKDIGHGARLLVSLLIDQGMSKAYLYQKSQDFFFRGSIGPASISNPQDILSFFDEIAPVSHEFDVFFIVSDEIKLVRDSTELFQIEIIDELPDDITELANECNFTPNDSELLVQIGDIRALDCFSARKEAERKIDMLRDLYTLYFHRSELSWRHETLISQCCIDAPAQVFAPKSPMQKAFDSTPAYASKRLKYLLRNLSLRRDDGQSLMKFQRIVDLHGISVTNEVPENQLLNLWISMETVVPTGRGRSSTIGRMVRAIEPFVRCTYVPRLVERTYYDLTLWNSFATRKILRKVPDSRGEKGHTKLLALLTIPDETHTSLLDELYVELKDFHLLRNRIFQLAERLSSNDSISEMIDQHAERVAWQFRRIYRTRNMLVHTGKAPRYLEAIIENGHDYLDLILDAIVALSCGPHNIRSLDQAFEFQKLQMIRMDGVLKKDAPLDWDCIDVFFGPDWLLNPTA